MLKNCDEDLFNFRLIIENFWKYWEISRNYNNFYNIIIIIIRVTVLGFLPIVAKWKIWMN